MDNCFMHFNVCQSTKSYVVKDYENHLFYFLQRDTALPRNKIILI